MSSQDTHEKAVMANILWSRRETEVACEPEERTRVEEHASSAREHSLPSLSPEGADSAAQLAARQAALVALGEEQVPFVVAGAYAMREYTGIYRDTKDLDIFCRRDDAGRALACLQRAGFRVEMTDPLWIAKGFAEDGEFVDVIFSSGNGVAAVDDEWFEHAPHGEVFAHRLLLTPPEEMIWSKAFVAERERFDGADVAHLIRAIGDQLDWHRVARRFERHWEVLLGHLMFYRFIYPSDRANVPDWLMVELLSRTMESVREGDWEERICRGPLMSRVNYGVDMSAWGYRDGRKWDEHERLKEELRRGLGSAIEDSSSSGG